VLLEHVLSLTWVYQRRIFIDCASVLALAASCLRPLVVLHFHRQEGEVGQEEKPSSRQCSPEAKVAVVEQKGEH
jgi:adenylosuccinate lyase